MVTIYDLSKITGFSPPTVSKALNGTGTISDKTRKLIINAAEEKGYTPNITARTLRTQKSRLIGILDANQNRRYDFISPFLSTVLGSFRETIETEGYDLILLTSLAEMNKMENSFISNYRNIDGILVMSVGGREKEFKCVCEYNKPCVSINDNIPNIGIVVTNNRQGARIAVEYLINLGHREIAYIAGPISNISIAARERRQGYHDVLIKNGIRIDPNLEAGSDTWHARGGYKACAELFRRKAKFTALFTANNHMGFGALRYMAESGIKVPKDISVIGFDDGDGLEEYISPSLSTMKQDSEKIGKIAAEMLLRKLQGLTTEKIIHIPAELAQRESTAKAPRRSS